MALSACRSIETGSEPTLDQVAWHAYRALEGETSCQIKVTDMPEKVRNS